MRAKNLFILVFSTITLYYIIPLLLLYFSSDEYIGKIGFIILLLVAFFSFAINLLYLFFIEKWIYTPVITSVLSVPMLYTFNSSAIVLIVLSLLFSFLGYFIGTLVK